MRPHNIVVNGLGAALDTSGKSGIRPMTTVRVQLRPGMLLRPRTMLLPTMSPTSRVGSGVAPRPPLPIRELVSVTSSGIDAPPESALYGLGDPTGQSPFQKFLEQAGAITATAIQTVKTVQQAGKTPRTPSTQGTPTMGPSRTSLMTKVLIGAGVLGAAGAVIYVARKI